MLQTNGEMTETVLPPVVFLENKDSKLQFIDLYYQSYFIYGTGASLIILPRKLEFIKNTDWRNYCVIPSKWEPNIIVHDTKEIIFLTPQKQAVICPVIDEEPDNISLGYLLGLPSKK